MTCRECRNCWTWQGDGKLVEEHPLDFASPVTTRYNIALTYNGGNKLLSAYINGALITSCTMRAGPSLIPQPVNLYLGKSLYPEDPTTSGSLTNFVIYNSVVP